MSGTRGCAAEATNGITRERERETATTTHSVSTYNKNYTTASSSSSPHPTFGFRSVAHTTPASVVGGSLRFDFFPSVFG